MQESSVVKGPTKQLPNHGDVKLSNIKMSMANPPSPSMTNVAYNIVSNGQYIQIMPGGIVIVGGTSPIPKPPTTGTRPTTPPPPPNNKPTPKLYVTYDNDLSDSQRQFYWDGVQKARRVCAAKGCAWIIENTRIRVTKYMPKPTWLGVFYSDTGIIDVKPYSGFYNTLIHELGHFYHFKNKYYHWMEGALKAKYNERGTDQFVTAYAKTNYIEMWAEMFRLWLKDELRGYPCEAWFLDIIRRTR